MRVNTLFIGFLFAAASLASCSKIDDDRIVEERITSINVINAGSDTLNVYQRGTRLNNGSNLTPGGQYLGLQVIAGATNYQLKKAGSAVTLIDLPLNIDPSKNFTLFVAGQSADRVFLLRDSLPAVGSDTTHIRFVNASPLADNGTIDVKVGPDIDYKNMAFKSATSFLKVNYGKISLSIRRTGDTTQIAKGTLTLTKNYTYTLFTKGVLGGTGNNAFGARILVARTN